MNITLNKNILIVAIIAVLFVVFTAVGSKILVDKVSVKVIEKLSKDYAPGPYSPGFDPDKVDPNFFRNQNQPMPRQDPSQQANPQQPNRQSSQMPPNEKKQYWNAPIRSQETSPTDWNKTWENYQR
jgi:hypothetical protein